MPTIYFCNITDVKFSNPSSHQWEVTDKSKFTTMQRYVLKSARYACRGKNEDAETYEMYKPFIGKWAVKGIPLFPFLALQAHNGRAKPSWNAPGFSRKLERFMRSYNGYHLLKKCLFENEYRNSWRLPVIKFFHCNGKRVNNFFSNFVNKASIEVVSLRIDTVLTLSS